MYSNYIPSHKDSKSTLLAMPTCFIGNALNLLPYKVTTQNLSFVDLQIIASTSMHFICLHQTHTLHHSTTTPHNCCLHIDLQVAFSSSPSLTQQKLPKQQLHVKHKQTNRDIQNVFPFTWSFKFGNFPKGLIILC